MNLRKRPRVFWLSASPIVVMVVVAAVLKLTNRIILKMPLLRTKPSALTAYFPFGVYYPLDPRRIVSVGDQVVSEHIFGFHSRQSIKHGFASVLSDVKFDQKKGLVSIHPKFEIRDSSGKIFSQAQVCSAAVESFKGTQHAPYRSLFLGAECLAGEVRISLKKIPVNLPFLFTLPDLSFFDPALLPIKPDHLIPTTDPYSIEEIHDREIVLKRNPFYPVELTANQVERARIRIYQTVNLDQWVSKLDPQKDHFIYFEGTFFNASMRAALELKNYRLNIYPSEWLLYAGISPNLDMQSRQLLRTSLDSLRHKILPSIPFGQSAYSIAPSDRPFGLTESEYSRVELRKNSGDISAPHRPVSVAVAAFLKDQPLVVLMLNHLTKSIPGLKIIYVTREQVSEFTSIADFYITGLGISPADPLSHLSFLMNDDPGVRSLVTEKLISELSTLTDEKEFVRRVKEIETQIVADQILVPLVHTPGIVAEAPGFEKAEDLAWSWGIQTWCCVACPMTSLDAVSMA